MRHIIYFSGKAQTSGNFDTRDLMRAGRIDIAIHSLIAGIFLSHGIREDVVFHLVFYGMPDPPKHIEITVKKGTPISKKDVANLIKKILYKYKEGEKREIFPGCFIEKKSLLKLIDELDKNSGENIFILDKKGEKLREVEIDIEKDIIFVVGDHEGFPLKELKRLKREYTPVSVGPKIYFASSVISIINNEIDLRE